MNVLYTILSFTIVFGIIVLVHEFGHYIAARLVGVRVEAFSFGFGKRIWGKKIGDTDFRVSLVPLGGYVKMAGEEEFDPEDLKPYEFQAKNRGQKIFILIMGPLMNLLLAFLIFTTLNMVGVPKDQYKKEPPVIGYVKADSPAHKAGLQKGDLILTINGKQIKDWEDLELTIGSNANENFPVQFKRDGKMLEAQLDIRAITRYSMGYVGVSWDFPVEVVEPVKDSPSAKAGLKKGDILLTIDKQPVNYYQLRERLTANIDKEIPFEFNRPKTVTVMEEGEEVKKVVYEKYTVLMTPVRTYYLSGSDIFKTEKEAGKHLDAVKKQLKEKNLKLNVGLDVRDGKYRVISQNIKKKDKAVKLSTILGLDIVEKGIVGFFPGRYSPRIVEQYGLFGAMKKGLSDIGRLTFMVFDVFRKMIRGKISPGSISGPLEIAKFSQKAMESGATNFFMLIAFISLQLGIINLFPIPALDGGHLLIYSIEAIIRKDFSPKVKMILMNIGFMLLVLLMVFIILNDIAKTLPNGWSSFLPF